MHCVNTILLKWDYRDTNKELDSIRSESLRQLRRLEYMSCHDGLTDLMNRSAFDSLLASELEKMEPAQTVAVVIVDLNGF